MLQKAAALDALKQEEERDNEIKSLKQTVSQQNSRIAHLTALAQHAGAHLKSATSLFNAAEIAFQDKLREMEKDKSVQLAALQAEEAALSYMLARVTSLSQECKVLQDRQTELQYECKLGNEKTEALLSQLQEEKRRAQFAQAENSQLKRQIEEASDNRTADAEAAITIRARYESLVKDLDALVGGGFVGEDPDGADASSFAPASVIAEAPPIGGIIPPITSNKKTLKFAPTRNKGGGKEQEKDLQELRSSACGNSDTGGTGGRSSSVSADADTGRVGTDLPAAYDVHPKWHSRFEELNKASHGRIFEKLVVAEDACKSAEGVQMELKREIRNLKALIQSHGDEESTLMKILEQEKAAYGDAEGTHHRQQAALETKIHGLTADHHTLLSKYEMSQLEVSCSRGTISRLERQIRSLNVVLTDSSSSANQILRGGSRRGWQGAVGAVDADSGGDDAMAAAAAAAQEEEEQEMLAHEEELRDLRQVSIMSCRCLRASQCQCHCQCQCRCPCLYPCPCQCLWL